MKKTLLLIVLFVLFAPSAHAADCKSGYVLSPSDLQTYNSDGSPCDVVESSGAPSNADSGSFGGTGANYRADAASASQSAAAAPTSSGEAQFVPIAPIPGLTQGATADPKGLADFLNNLYKYLVGLAAVIAVVEIVLGGIDMATKDSVPLHLKGKERIQQALLGLLLVLSPVIVFSIINPSILNLSVNLPPLDTKAANYGVAPSRRSQLECGNGISTNCIPRTIKHEGVNSAPVSGQWCFERAGAKATDPNDFICSTLQSDCEKVFKDQMSYDKSALTSCKQY